MSGETDIRAAIYLRISLDRDMDGLAIDRQEKECLAICKQRGWKPIEPFYIDQSKSATNKAKKRPAYDQMVKDYEAGKFDAIVCYDLDRLTRQPRQLEDWIDAAQEQGLQLVTANGSADLATDSGRLFARVKAAVAREEVERKGARQHSAHVQRAEQGRPPHGVRPLGYDNKGNVIPDEAEAVRAIYDSFIAGASLKAIARALSGDTSDDLPNIPTRENQTRVLVKERNARREAEGKPTKPVPDNKPWNPASVLGILRNPRYAAYSTYTPTDELKEGDRRRKWYEKIVRDEDGNPIMGTWEAIIEADKWERVQEILNDPERQTSRKGTDRKHLGSGLFECGICGKKVRAHSRVYRCAGHVMRSRKQIDLFVTEAVKARLSQPDLSDLLSERDAPREKKLSKQIADHKARILRAQADYDAEIIEGYDLKRIRDKENAEIAKLEAERLKLVDSTVASLLQCANPAEAFENTDLARKRAVIDMLCTVTLFPHPRGIKKFDGSDVSLEWRTGE